MPYRIDNLDTNHPMIVEAADGPFPHYDDAGKEVIRYQHEKGRIAHEALAWIRAQIRAHYGQVDQFAPRTARKAESCDTATSSTTI